MLQVKKLVNEHKNFVHSIAKELLKKGDLTGEQIDQIYVRLYGQSRPAPPAVRIMNSGSKNYLSNSGELGDVDLEENL